MQNEEKIKAAIADYLQENLIAYHDGYTDTLGWKRFAPGMQSEITAELYAAIAPHLGALEPDWNVVPPWANFIATDWNGQKFCYEYEPYKTDQGCWSNTSGRFEIVDTRSKEPWFDSLKKRPQ